MNTAEMEKVVCETVLQIVQRRSPDAATVTREQGLTKELGFSSMDYAELVATLETQLGVDPFAEEVSITDIRKVGDLIEAYGRVLNR